MVIRLLLLSLVSARVTELLEENDEIEISQLDDLDATHYSPHGGKGHNLRGSASLAQQETPEGMPEMPDFGGMAQASIPNFQEILPSAESLPNAQFLTDPNLGGPQAMLGALSPKKSKKKEPEFYDNERDRLYHEIKLGRSAYDYPTQGSFGLDDDYVYTNKHLETKTTTTWTTTTVPEGGTTWVWVPPIPLGFHDWQTNQDDLDGIHNPEEIHQNVLQDHRGHKMMFRIDFVSVVIVLILGLAMHQMCMLGMWQWQQCLVGLFKLVCCETVCNVKKVGQTVALVGSSFCQMWGGKYAQFLKDDCGKIGLKFILEGFRSIFRMLKSCVKAITDNIRTCVKQTMDMSNIKKKANKKEVGTTGLRLAGLKQELDKEGEKVLEDMKKWDDENEKHSGGGIGPSEKEALKLKAHEILAEKQGMAELQNEIDDIMRGYNDHQELDTTGVESLSTSSEVSDESSKASDMTWGPQKTSDKSDI